MVVMVVVMMVLSTAVVTAVSVMFTVCMVFTVGMVFTGSMVFDVLCVLAVTQDFFVTVCFFLFHYVCTLLPFRGIFFGMSLVYHTLAIQCAGISAEVPSGFPQCSGCSPPA